MKENVDALLVINNERLREIYADGITTAKEAFCKADDILTTATKSIAEIITIEGTINRDFCDVETIMKDGGSAIMAMGRAKGKYRIQNAILDALNSPLLNDNDIEKAQKLLYIIYSSKENPILINELSELNTFMEELDPNIEVIWGLYDDDSLGEDVKITLIATGFDNKKDSVNAEISDDVRLKSEIEKYYKPTPEPLSKQVQSAIVESNNDTKEEITETQEPITFEETTSHSTKEKLITRLSNIISKLMEDE